MLTLNFFPGQIKRLQEKSNVGHEFFAGWTPRRTLLGDKILEESGVLGDVTSSEFELYFQPLDHDLLSLELSESFEDLFLVCRPITNGRLNR